MLWLTYNLQVSSTHYTIYTIEKISHNNNWAISWKILSNYLVKTDLPIDLIWPHALYLLLEWILNNIFFIYSLECLFTIMQLILFHELLKNILFFLIQFADLNAYHWVNWFVVLRQYILLNAPFTLYLDIIINK